MNRTVLKSAWLTVLTLFGGLAAGLMAGSLVFELIPGSSVEEVQLGHAAIAAIPAVAGFLAGGAAWGVAMGRLAGASDTRRMGLAGLLGFGPISIALALTLGLAEPALVASFGGTTPIHRIFTLLFVPSAFLIAGISAWAIGRGLKDNALATALLWRVGPAAAVSFLAVNLAMEAAGWVVGAPGAAARATMVTVLAAGNLTAALAAGGLMGWLLSSRQYR